MLQHTLDRADQISAPACKVTVIARSHRWAAWPQLRGRPGSVILQPANRGTAAAIFLAVAHVRACDPKATVVIYPSDHFVYPETRFVEMVRATVLASQQLKSWLFLLGVSPDGLETEYGWIHPGQHLGWMGGNRVRAVEAFLEKPDLEKCRAAIAAGDLWSTLILAAGAESLWAIGRHCFPDMIRLFERYREAIGTSQQGTFLQAAYAGIPQRDFSSDLLARIPKQIAVIELRDVLWCDWGQPQRIVESLRRIGRPPAFPLRHVAGLDLRQDEFIPQPMAG